MLQLTVEYCGEGVLPKEVFICATVDQGLNVVNACKALGIDTVLCRGHRLNSSVMWSLGINGSVNTCKNAEMKALVSKCAALVGVFSHSAVNNDALREIQTNMHKDKQKEVDDLLLQADRFAAEVGEQSDAAIPSSPVNTIRRNDTRCALGKAAVANVVPLRLDPRI